jgi:hypothetical protein
MKPRAGILNAFNLRPVVPPRRQIHAGPDLLRVFTDVHLDGRAVSARVRGFLDALLDGIESRVDDRSFGLGVPGSLDTDADFDESLDEVLASGIDDPVPQP